MLQLVHSAQIQTMWRCVKMTALQTISLALGIGTTIAGAIIALVNLGIKVGTINHKIESLEVDNKKDREKIDEMGDCSNQQNVTIKLLEQKLDTMCDDIKDVKNTLNEITKYIKESEAEKVKIESRLDYLEKSIK